MNREVTLVGGPLDGRVVSCNGWAKLCYPTFTNDFTLRAAVVRVHAYDSEGTYLGETQPPQFDYWPPEPLVEREGRIARWRHRWWRLKDAWGGDDD